MFLLIGLTAMGVLSARAADKTETGREKVSEILGTQFRIGFHLYLGQYKQPTHPEIEDVFGAINQMADLGFNAVYVATTGNLDERFWSGFLNLCQERGMAVTVQMNQCYLMEGLDLDALIAVAVPFIQKYKDHPAVTAFSVKEEPTGEILPMLAKYYEGILEKVPDAPLYLLHNQFLVSQMQGPPFPMFAGTDRYPFWWEFGASRNMATPASALEWYRSQIDAYYQLAKERKQEFEVVFTDWIQQYHLQPAEVKRLIYPVTMSEREKEVILQRFVRLAKENNQGVSLGKDNRLNFWKNYRPPGNCTSAMAWLAVMEGADSLSIFYWSSPMDEMKRWLPEHGGTTVCTTVGWEDLGTPSLAEYVQFAREIRPFGGLIRAMTKETAPMANAPLGHEVAVTQARRDPPLRLEENQASWSSFTVPGYEGKVVMVVNTEVGSWCDGRSPVHLTESDRYQIDDKGNLMGYQPFYLARQLACEGIAEGTACVDLSSGETLPVRNGTMNLPVLPGRGRILFFGRAGSGEAEKLIREYRLPALLALAEPS